MEEDQGIDREVGWFRRDSRERSDREVGEATNGREWFRRNLLASGVAVSSSALLTGCLGFLGGGEDGDADSTPTTTPTPTSTPTETPTRTPDDTGDDGDGTELPTGSLHVTQEVEPAYEFDPVVLDDAYSGVIAGHLYDGLYEYGPGLELEPKLAAGDPEVEREGTRYVFEIRDDARFHDGDPVTADDVLHSFVAPVVEGTENASSFDVIDVDASTTIDDTALQVDLEESYAPFRTMTMAVSVVKKSARLDAMGLSEDEWRSHDWENQPLYADSAYNLESPVGSGPFRYADHAEGEYVDLERWDDYWDEPVPNLAAVRWTAEEDDDDRVERIREGETDLVTGVPREEWDAIDRTGGVDLHSEQDLSYYYVAYNCNEGPTAETDVRAGVENAFSAAQFVDRTVAPAGENAVAPLPDPVLSAWDLPVEEYRALGNDHDSGRAADLIAPHVEGTWEPRIVAPPDPIRNRLAQRIAVGLSDLDLDVEVDPEVSTVEWPEFFETVLSGDADDYAMYVLAWAGGADPDSYLWYLFHEAAAGVTQGHYYDPETDFHERLREARETTDVETRRDHYDAAIREILDETVHTPVYSTRNSVAARSGVEDLQVHHSRSLVPRLVSGHNNVSVE